MAKKYNRTQLNPDASFERHIYHRDQFAHYLRWTHILKKIKPNLKANVLDFGCGTSGNLAEVLYRNRHKANKYLGLDIRSLDTAKDKFAKVPWVEFKEYDLVETKIDEGTDWDVITSFEVLEHIGKENADKFLQNIVNNMNAKTKLYLSTPNYDEKVGAAQNHIIDGEVCEFEYEELKAILEKYFNIEQVFGTFASQKDYKELMTEQDQKVFDKLREYYDSNLVSVIMAPLMPASAARNCMWVLTLK